MKILIMGDVHLRYMTPENRTDNFFETQFEKMREVFELAGKHDCRVILQPGDLWDNPHPAKYVMSRYIQLFKEYEDIKFYTVIGQHDMTMRNFASIDRGASHLLQSAGVLEIVGLDKEPVCIDADSTDEADVLIHGLSFEQDYSPKPSNGYTNILLAHASVGNKPLFPGHVLESPRRFAQNYPGFDLMVLGDYHYTWEDKYQGTVLVDAGCLVRKTIDERDLKHIPGVFIYDTQDKTVHFIELKCVKPWNEVFHIAEKSDSTNSRLLQFMAVLRAEKSLSVSFNDNLNLWLKKNKTDNAIVSRIVGALDQAGASKEELQCLMS